ncbi:hypothetical protein AOLI_G00160840 [Acnodon oligacanthus]
MGIERDVNGAVDQDNILTSMEKELQGLNDAVAQRPQQLPHCWTRRYTSEEAAFSASLSKGPTEVAELFSQ